MSKTLLGAIALGVLMACGGGDRDETATADSLSRDLQLAPVDTTAALNDQPPAETETETATRPEPAPPAAPRPRPRTEEPARTAAPDPVEEPAPRGLAAGTSFGATMVDSISSARNKVGDVVTAKVASDVKDAQGRTVIPKGSRVSFKITAIQESENKSDSTGTLTLMPGDITVGGESYPLMASIDKVNTRLVDRGTNVGDVAKVGAGAAAGAVVGRVLGGGKTGAIIGGVLGGAVGTQRAVETQDRDVVVTPGSTVTLTLKERFTT